MNKKTLLVFALVAVSYLANAQKGTNKIQVAGQVGFPTGDLADVAKTGFGAAAKGMLGFSAKPQYVTLEAGYNNFSVKNLPSSVNANYSSVPIYLGYRANLSGVILESQAGVSLNHIEAAGPGGTVSANQTGFGWALSAGYEFKNVELSVRYQNSEAESDSQKIRFVGIRLGYNFSL